MHTWPPGFKTEIGFLIAEKCWMSYLAIFQQGIMFTANKGLCLNVPNKFPSFVLQSVVCFKWFGYICQWTKNMFRLTGMFLMFQQNSEFLTGLIKALRPRCTHSNYPSTITVLTGDIAIGWNSIFQLYLSWKMEPSGFCIFMSSYHTYYSSSEELTSANLLINKDTKGWFEG